jgi:hypothetical protein
MDEPVDQSRGLLFYRLLQLAVKVDPVRESQIIAPKKQEDEEEDDVIPF